MNNVEAHQQRNVQARLVNGNMLQPIDLLHFGQPEDGPHPALPDVVIRFLVNEVLDDDPGLLVELASFLLDRHLFQQRVGATSDFGVGEGLCLCVESGCGDDQRKRNRSGDSEELGFHRLMADENADSNRFYARMQVRLRTLMGRSCGCGLT